MSTAMTKSAFWQSFAIVAVLALCVVCQATFAQSAKYNQNYEDALVRFHNKDYATAEIYLKKALQDTPDHLPARVLLAEVYLARGNGSLAESELNYAQKTGGDLNKLIPLLAQSYLLQYKYKEVLAWTYPAARPTDVEVKIANLRASALIRMRRLSDAEDSLLYALKYNKDSTEAILGLSQIALINKQYLKALALVNEVIKIEPENITAWISKSKLESITGEIDEAIESSARAVDIDPDNVAARLTRASMYINKKAFELADVDIQFILDSYPFEPRATYLRAIVRAFLGDKEGSATNLAEVSATLQVLDEQVLEANPDFYYLAGIANYDLGRLDLSRVNLKKYLRLDEYDMRALRLLALVEFQLGNTIAARSVLLKANLLEPNSPDIISLLGSVYLELGEFSNAEQSFIKVLNLAPDSANDLVNLARSKFATKDYSQAIEHLLKAEELKPSDVEIKLLLIETYKQSRQLTLALKRSLALLDLNPKSSLFLQIYGQILGLSGQEEQAENAFERSLVSNSQNMVSTIYLARIEFNRGEIDRAISRLTDYMERFGEQLTVMHEISQIYLDLEEYDYAISWLKKAESVNPNSEKTLEQLVKTYQAQDNIDAAIAAADEFLRKDGTSSSAYLMLGNLYFQQQQQQSAIRAIQSAVKYAQEKSPVLLNMAQVQLAGKDVNGAIYTLNRAIFYDEGYLPAYVKLTNIYIRTAKVTEAEKLIASIRQISTTTPAADLLAGDLYQSKGDYLLAEKYYLKALEFGDTEPAIIGLYAVYRKLGRLTAFIPTMEDWIKRFPTDINVSLALATGYGSLGRSADARVIYERLTQRHSTNIKVLNNAANYYRRNGELERAFELGTQAFELAPQSVTVMDTLAWIEYNRGNYREALALLRNASELDSGNPEIQFHLALTLDKVARRGEAIPLLQAALRSGVAFEERDYAQALLATWL